MLSLSNFGSGIAPIGSFQVNSHNFSNINEIYPQAPAEAILPQLRTSFDYSPYYSVPTVQSKNRYNFHISRMEDDLRKSLQHQSHQHQEANERLLQKRNGPSGSPGWGWKEVGGGWNRSNGNSPALSALALLGFMFFLNLIQTSLQNNRQMLTAAALNATTVGVVAGRSGGKLRYTRDTEYLNLKNRFMSEIPAVREPMRRNEKFEQFPTTQHPYEFMRRGRPSSNATSNDNLPNVIHGSTQNETISTHKNENENPVEDFKSTSLECFQLLACKIGHSIYGSLDSTTGLIVRMLGASVVPRLPRATWSGRLMRAFNKGWRNGKVCEKLYTKCHLLDILAFNTTRFPPVVRRRKSKEQLRRNYWYK